MEPRLRVLNLLLTELGMDPSIETVDKRKAIQKAVYLAQVAGADLGYRYGWYLRGPYSSALTKDYYALADQPSSSTADGGVHLHPSWIGPASAARGLMEPPVSALSQPDWLELVSSVHFLRKVVGLDPTATLDRMTKEKPNLVQWLPDAGTALQKVGLLD